MGDPTSTDEPRGDEDTDLIAREDQGPAERLIGTIRRAWDRRATDRAIGAPASIDEPKPPRDRMSLVLWLAVRAGIVFVGAAAVSVLAFVSSPTSDLAYWTIVSAAIVGDACLAVLAVAWVIGLVELVRRREWLWFVVCVFLPWLVVVFALIERRRPKTPRLLDEREVLR